MSELGDLLELLYGAAERYQSVASRWRWWHHEARMRDAFEAHARRQGGVSGSFGTGPRERPAEREERIRVWFQAPDRFREEYEDGERSGRLTVQNGSNWWTHTPGHGSRTNAGDTDGPSQRIDQSFATMLDPAPVIGLLRFELSGRGERAGRPVLLAHATPRPIDGPRDLALRGLGIGADDYAVEIDAERGILLRVEARIGAGPLMVREALEITFDEPFDPRLFEFVAPDGEAPATSADLRRRMAHVPLHEAAAAAPFTVYAVADPPADWELRVILHRPTGSLGQATVWLHYMTRDHGSQVNIGEMPATAAEDYRVRDGEQIEHDGRTMHIRRRTESWPQAQLSTELGDTLITMNSDTLSADDLVALIERLAPAAPDAPRL